MATLVKSTPHLRGGCYNAPRSGINWIMLKSTPRLRGYYNHMFRFVKRYPLKSTHRFMGCYNWQTLAAKRSKEEFSSPPTTSNSKSAIVPPGAKMFFARLSSVFAGNASKRLVSMRTRTDVIPFSPVWRARSSSDSSGCFTGVVRSNSARSAASMYEANIDGWSVPLRRISHPSSCPILGLTTATSMPFVNSLLSSFMSRLLQGMKEARLRCALSVQ